MTTPGSTPISANADLSALEFVSSFENPPTSFGPLPIWWWSGETIKAERLRWQMEQLVSQGIYQAVVMNLAPTGPLYGSLADDPPFMSSQWWALFEGACHDAQELGFQLWPYDQIGFSGANIQGTLAGQNPDFGGYALERISARAIDLQEQELRCPKTATVVAGYFVPDAPDVPSMPLAAVDGVLTWTGEAGRLELVIAQPHGFDYFSPEACSTLIDVIFGEYERQVGHWFGTAIGGFFQDELPAMPTWSLSFADSFSERYGYNLLTHVPALWGDASFTDATKAGWQVRLDYHRLRAELADDAFFVPLADWYASTGLICGFDQQSPAREADPKGAVALYGDYLETHSRFAAPGNDHWGDTKVHSSLAHSEGHPRVWIEAFHSSGWGGTLEETYDWLSPYLRRGATLYNPHAVYYSTRAGFWEWAPPSTCWRQPYWPNYHVFSDTVRRLCSVLSAGTHVASTILLFPTESMQANLTVDSCDLSDREATRIFHQLNGTTPWFAESPGVLEQAGIDYDVYGHSSLRSARVEGNTLRVGDESFKNVVIPSMRVLTAPVASLLLDLARAGGRVAFIGSLPNHFPGRNGSGDNPELRAELVQAARNGELVVIQDAKDVPEILLDHAVSVRANAPFLHRRSGENHLIMVTAHDDATGTVQPMLEDFDYNWIDTGFNWDTYWKKLTTDSYDFRPVGDRQLTVNVSGLFGVEVQRWDPRTGLRSAIPTTTGPDGSLIIQSDFSDGSITLLVIGIGLPAPTATALDRRSEVLAGIDEWRVLASSTLENRWGDLAPLEDGPTIPIQVWSFDHATLLADESEEGAEWIPVLATFGVHAKVSAIVETVPTREAFDATGWRDCVWSLSRGIREDPINRETLGPNGYVPEEFLDWPHVKSGNWVAVRTTIDLRALNNDVSWWLAVGSGADRRVHINGVEHDVNGDGYLSYTPLSTGKLVDLEVWFSPAFSGTVRASFAVVSDLDAYNRPEWLEPVDGSVTSTSVEMSLSFLFEENATDTRAQVSTESPATVRVNGTIIGQQGSFDPYGSLRTARVIPYDIGPYLRAGHNRLSISLTDVGRPPAALVDSIPTDMGGLGIMSDASWSATRESEPVDLRLRKLQFQDPRFVCLTPRPHPLQGATWLEPAGRCAIVERIVPGVEPLEHRTELLRFVAPVGTTSIEVPADQEFSVQGIEHSRIGTRVDFDEPAAIDTTVTLRFTPGDGRRGGALVSGPLRVEAQESASPLRTWSELGFTSLGGQVTYTAPISGGIVVTDGERIVLDLGTVRGAAAIHIDDVLVDTLLWSPWRADVTDWVTNTTGKHTLRVTVTSTLAQYMQQASPTPAVMAGQTRHGLLGPVRLERWTTHH